MNENISHQSTSSKPRFAWIPYLVATILLLSVLMLWRELSSTRQSLAALVQKQSTLAEELKSAKTELDQVKSGDSSIETRERLETARSARAAQPVKEEKETLFLQTPTVEPTADGLAVRFSFNPSDGIELPDQITLVVRVPGDSGVKILSLKPISEPNYSSIAHLVNAKGDLGMIEGSPSDLRALEYELIVSGPIKALVRGSDGIKDFELNITADECNVRQL